METKNEDKLNCNEDKLNFQPLMDVFHVPELEINTRDMCGMIIGGHVYFEKAHRLAMWQFENDHPKQIWSKVKHATFHVIGNNLIIDMVPLLTNMSLEEIVATLKQQAKKYKLYLFHYQDHTVAEIPENFLDDNFKA